MPNAYDVGLRRRAVMAYERGEGSYAALSVLFDIHPRTLERWVARWRVAQSVEPRPRGGGWRSPIDVAIVHVLARRSPMPRWRRCAANTTGASHGPSARRPAASTGRWSGKDSS